MSVNPSPKIPKECGGKWSGMLCNTPCAPGYGCQREVGVSNLSDMQRGPGSVEKTATHQSITGEVRITDPWTGGQKGQKQAQLGALDPQSLMEVAKVAGFGAIKYSRYNFMKGYAWSLSYDALQRHLHAFWDGEDRDPESGHLHLAHAAWHCLTMITFLLRGRGTDDRHTSEEE